MKYLLLILMFLSVPVLAQDAKTTNEQLQTKIAAMSDAEKATLLSQIETPDKPAADVANDWIDVGERLGSGLAATAREMGIAVNDFATTPIGKLTVIVLLWNFMGDDLAKIGVSLSMMFVFLPTWLIVARNLFGTRNSEGKIIGYDLSRQDWGEGFMPVALILVFLGILLFAAIPVLNI